MNPQDQLAPAPAPQPSAVPPPAFTPPPAAPPAFTPAPDSMGAWPGAFGIYKFSRAAVMVNLGPLLLLIVVLIVGTFAFTFALTVVHLAWLGQLISDLLEVLFSGAFIALILSGTRSERLEVGAAISKSASFYVRLLILEILTGLSVVAGFLLFLIPGLIILPRLCLAPYFLIDQNLGAMEAYKASWAATKGHAMKFYGIVGAVIVMCLPIITIIGALATIYLVFMYSAAVALLYRYVTHNQSATSLPTAPATQVMPGMPTQ